MNEQAKITDQFDRWRRAVAGEPLEIERHNPASGYYRRFADAKRIEAIAVWRDDSDALKCWRNVYGDGSRMDADDIDMLFADKNMLAVPYEVFQAVTEGGAEWPSIYHVKLRTKDMNAGVIWTETWATAQVASAAVFVDPEEAQELSAKIDKIDHEMTENPRAIIGDNAPPERTPEETLADKITAKGEQLAAALKAMGGKPTTKSEADQVANYAVKFKDLANEATTAHKVEKEPHLTAGRDVDGRWFPVRDKAEECRKRALKIADEWTNAEKVRRAEEARLANEAARKRAEAEAKITGEAAAPIEEVVPEKVKLGTGRTVSQRTVQVWTVTDLPAFLTYLGAMETTPPDLLEACEKVARKLGSAGVRAPGIELKERVSSS